jgi:hypothetical protein
MACQVIEHLRRSLARLSWPPAFLVTHEMHSPARNQEINELLHVAGSEGKRKKLRLDVRWLHQQKEDIKCSSCGMYLFQFEICCTSAPGLARSPLIRSASLRPEGGESPLLQVDSRVTPAVTGVCVVCNKYGKGRVTHVFASVIQLGASCCSVQQHHLPAMRSLMRYTVPRLTWNLPSYHSDHW